MPGDVWVAAATTHPEGKGDDWGCRSRPSILAQWITGAARAVRATGPAGAVPSPPAGSRGGQCAMSA